MTALHNKSQPGSQIRCPHCRRWHDVITVHTEGTAYTVAMRYWECRGRRFYAGQAGGTSRHATRLFGWEHSHPKG